ncbi:hypothetical protein EV44_g2048 [Erysiphe necator]|uniref:Uncharacterized protein n=1 Tax=Uncinula necator TaxID=52586 RepID=A0A0B1P2C5_UNCNE|nr:hypothetical protein EV44_g2048 [Erysiphe necator]
MPFDFAAYKAKCDALTTQELQLEWQNYTRQLTSGATLTTTSVMMSPLTSGISLVALGISVPQIHNARRKRAIIGNKLQSHGMGPHTRRRDIIIPAAITITTSGLTLGATPLGSELIGGEAGVKGIEYLATHVVLDTMWAILDEAQNSFHHRRSKRKLKRMQSQQRQHLARDMKSDEYSKHSLDMKKSFLEDGDFPSARRGLRSYYIEEDDYYYNREQQAPPPAYSKKYVYQRGQVQFAYDSQASHGRQTSYTHPSTVSNRRRHYSSSGLGSGSAIENLGLLRSSAAARRSSAHGNSRPAIYRPTVCQANRSSYSKKHLIPRYQMEEICENESALESDLESEDEISDQDKSNDEEDDEDSDSDRDSDSDSDSDNDEDSDVENEKPRTGKTTEHVLTLEQEINILKATILRLEMEKRGLMTETKKKKRQSSK